MSSPRSPPNTTYAESNPAIMGLASRETQEQMHSGTMTNTQFRAKEMHQPIAIFIGIIVFLALMMALYFFTKWRFGKIVDEKVPKKTDSSFNSASANAALKSSLSGMDGLQMALLFGSGAVAIGCAYAYMLSKKHSDLEQGLALHAQTSARLAGATLKYSTHGAVASIERDGMH